MKNRIRMILTGSIIGVCLLLAGCGANKKTLIIASELAEETETGSQFDVPEESGTDRQLDVSEEAGTDSPADSLETAGKLQDAKPSEQEVYVYVCGAVENPGVYILNGVPRICDAVDAAGGFCENAAESYWNMAEIIADGQMIYVPTTEEAEERNWDVLEKETSAKTNEHPAETNPTDDAGKKVNLNTASKEQLMLIPGIGEAKADSIISYREKNGAFSKVEEVMNISGIKDGLFEKMKEYITVE